MGNSNNSKKLGHDDSSGFEFVKYALGDNVTAAVNFDRLQKHPVKGYIIFELLKCEETQNVTPYTSHPKRYWDKNANKFLALWRAKQDFGATLYLVNYAEAGTRYSDQVLVIEVLNMDENGITKENITKYTMDTFSRWFSDLNNQCLVSKDELADSIYENKTIEELGNIKLRKGKHLGETLSCIHKTDIGYLEWHSKQSYEYSNAAKWYLRKMIELKNNQK